MDDWEFDDGPADKPAPRATEAMREAALELYLALKYTVPFVEKWCHYQGNLQEFHDTTMRLIHEAIARAEGRRT